jgi:hypothetical protein
MPLALFLLTSLISTAEVRPTKPYDCFATIVAKDGIHEFKFKAPVVSESGHGGTPFEFHEGEHTLGVIADGKWRGISWFRGDVRVVESVTVSKSFLQSGHVLIAYNPADTDEQAYVVCNHEQLDSFPRE